MKIAVTRAFQSRPFMPTLTEEPSPKGVVYGISVSVIASIAIATRYLISADFNRGQGFGLIACIMAGHAVLSFFWFQGNILIFLRYALLFMPTFTTAIAWWLWKGSVLTGPFGPEFQTVGSTSLLVTCGCLSLMGCTIGWLAAFYGYRRNPSCLPAAVVRERQPLLWFGMALVVGFGGLYVLQAGGPLSANRTYGSGGEGIGLGFEFGVANIFQQLGVSCLLLLAAVFRRNRLKLYLLIVSSLLMGVMVGSRADYLPPWMIVSLFFLTMYLNRDSVSNIRAGGIWSRAKKLILFGLMGAIVFVAASGVAIWRSAPSLSIVAIASELFDRGPELLVSETYGHRMLYIETGNMMIGGMYGLIENAERNGFLMGRGYADYLLRSPPAFLGLDRPLDLAWNTGVGDTVMSQGGVFEPAEAYTNFGWPGCFVVSFLLSYFMASLLKVSNNKGSILFLCWYLVYGLMGLRSIWYQTFAYFRLGTIFVLLYGVLLLVRPKMVYGERSG